MKKSWFSIIALATLAINQLASASPLPTPPDRGTPQGNPVPGGTRPESRCQSTQQPLTALIANQGKDFTVSSYPAFWFYIPYTPENIRYIEFALKNPQTQTTIYRTAVKVLNTPGLMKISLPETEKYALEMDKSYHWDLLLYCTANQTDEPDLRVDGWIKRISLNTPLKTTEDYINHEVWYDAIAQTVEQRFTDLNNQQMDRTWINLLQLLGQKSLVSAQLANIELAAPQE